MSEVACDFIGCGRALSCGESLFVTKSTPVWISEIVGFYQIHGKQRMSLNARAAAGSFSPRIQTRSIIHWLDGEVVVVEDDE